MGRFRQCFAWGRREREGARRASGAPKTLSLFIIIIISSHLARHRPVAVKVAHRALLALDRLEEIALVVHVLHFAMPSARPLGRLFAPLLELGQALVPEALEVVVVLHAVVERAELVVQLCFEALGDGHDGLLHDGGVGGGHGSVVVLERRARV